LFEKPYNKLDNYNQFASAEFRNKAYKSATESITLLKNNGVLPLSKNKKVLVVGPTSNSLICLNGAWTHTWQGLGSENNKFISNQYNNDFPTILDAVNKKNNGIVHHINGIDFVMKDGDESEKFNSDINFLNIAKSCDYIIVCLGELPSTERPGDLNTLEMTALQKDLVRRLENFNVPKILVLVQGRPKIIRDIEPKFDAVLNAYLPGDQGGVAIADILFGDINPSGKLPYTYPLYPEVILHYDYKQTETINGNTWSNDFYQSQYDFGFGLSYSNFEYSNLKINKKKINEREEIIISVDVENTSDITGKEVVQLYTRDHYATIAPPLKKLQRFTKIELSAKEKKTVNFTLSEKDLRFFGIENKWISENGKFSIFINQLEEEFTLIKS
jgi:beta-glucosidase